MLAEALARLPHAGGMRLIAEVEHADRMCIGCQATDHSELEYSLRVDGVLYAAALVELGAQAAAAHASVFGIGAAHAGLVVALSNVELRCVEIDNPARLRVQAERLEQIEGAATYRFTVVQDEVLLVTGEILLSMVPA